MRRWDHVRLVAVMGSGAALLFVASTAAAQDGGVPHPAPASETRASGDTSGDDDGDAPRDPSPAASTTSDTSTTADIADGTSDGGPEGAADTEPDGDGAPVATPVTVAQASDDEAPPDADAPPDDAAAGVDWTDHLHITGFADAYLQGTWTSPEPFNGDQSAVMGHRPYTFINGLTVSFLGMDLAYEGDDVGATLNIRFGTSTPRLLGPSSGLPDGMQFLKQAYVYWRPFEGAEIDFGQFDTVYGAEVSESWRNHNYSRGALYNLVQPFYHTGFRLSYAPPDSGITITGLAVNGWNNVVDNNDMKTFGLQVGYANGGLTASAGYLGGPEADGDDDHWRHFADVVVNFAIDDLSLTFNGNYVADDVGGEVFDQSWGVMLSGRLRFPPFIALALRGEFLGDPETDTGLGTATFTFEVIPAEHLVFRLDNRLDVSTEAQFQDPSGNPSEVIFSTILGAVVMSD